MRCTRAFALVILFCLPASAQQEPPKQELNSELELLELEQEVDKASLREALKLQASWSMQEAIDPQSAKNSGDARKTGLSDFISEKKDAIRKRAALMAKSRLAPKPAKPAITVAPVDPSAKAIKLDSIEKTENAQVEVQLLQAQIGLLQSPLLTAISELAAAEFAASSDDAQKPKVDAARKKYEQIKAKYVEYRKRLQVELQLGGTGIFGGMGGMGGGMGGMGGGMR